MENASNALIMAAEILIAILVLTLIVTINVLFGSFSRSVNDQIARTRDTTFNARFYNYANRANISASEVATIINFSKVTNDENGYKRINPGDSSANQGAPYYINVYINGEAPSNSFFYGYNGYIPDNTVYNDAAKFKDAVNRFISDNKQKAFCCNVKSMEIPELDPTSPTKPVVKLTCKTDKESDVTITDNNHLNVKQDSNIRVVRIVFRSIEYVPKTGPGDPYDITTSNEYEYIVK